MTKKSDPRNWKTNTKLVRGGTIRSQFGETSEAIFLNSGYCYDSAETAQSRFDGTDPGFVYSRYVNPSLTMLEEKLAILEGADKAIVMASGMAAMFASIMCQVKAGDHFIAGRVLFGSCFYVVTQVLPRYGIEVTLVDGRNLDEWKAAFKPNTTCVFVESPSNPSLEIIDLEEVGRLCKENNASFIVDNIFATPLLQKPFDLGADLVIYSTTKHMDGQGRSIGGAVIGPEPFMTETLLPFHRHTGPHMSPFNAWIALKGLETLEIRMERQGQNAQAIAEFLEQHPNVQQVLYPGLKSHPQYELAQKQMSHGGTLIAFEVKGGKDAAFAMMNKLQVMDISNNLGDTKTLITHPATTTHSSMDPAVRNEYGITDDLIRLSVGLEDVSDLIGDLEQAL